MIALNLLWLAAQGFLVFTASTVLFDALHYLLHRWQRSRFKLLRTFSAWHNVHHEFLDKSMQVHPELVRENFWCHLLPEYGTSMAGTLVFGFVFSWWAVGAIALLHTVLFVLRIIEEGRDYNHMSMNRLSGQKGFWFVNPSYHALHHIHPMQFYSSFINVFDLIVGTNAQIRGRTFLVTGANGAFGSAMVKRLQALGAKIETAKFGIDYSVGSYEGLHAKMARADVLLLAHGAKSNDCWNANYRTFTDLIDMFTEMGKTRLVPPEVWAVGSEIELHGDLGMASLKSYAASKKAFAARARAYYTSKDLMYRHIVPAAFTSSMGKGMMSADTAAAIALFFLRRGFAYVPVSFTTLAHWNYLRFRFWQRPQTDTVSIPAE
jgi:monoglucosyldiacylglycerol epimerase